MFTEVAWTAVAFTVKLHVGVALKIPDAIVIAHAAVERFPIADSHDPDCDVIDEEASQLSSARSIRSTVDEFDVNAPIKIGAGIFCPMLFTVQLIAALFAAVLFVIVAVLVLVAS